MSLAQELRHIAENVEAIESQEGRHATCLGEMIATLRVNYGPNGKARPGIIWGNEKPIQMLVKVLQYLEEAPEAKERDQRERERDARRSPTEAAWEEGSLIQERDTLWRALDEILNYEGSADSPLEDEYVMNRACQALEGDYAT